MADKKPTLLIVEDDEGLQAQLKWAYDDFEVVIAGDRDSAIAALRSEAPAQLDAEHDLLVLTTFLLIGEVVSTLRRAGNGVIRVVGDRQRPWRARERLAGD